MEQLGETWGFPVFKFRCDAIETKPVRRWPYRASYRAQVRDARKRRKGGRP